MPVSASDVIVKIVILFLVFMAVLAMFGKVRVPGQEKLAAARCANCGRFRIGKGPCTCRKGKRK
jgi:1-acyl-sn-glycerol-3-phosphate acyltransferase